VDSSERTESSVWALLAILGVPLWLVVGVLVSCAVSRRNFRRHDDVFAVALRSNGAAKWRRGLIYGRQVREVLLVNRGAALLRTEFYVVDGVADIAPGVAPNNLPDAVSRLVAVDDGTRLEVAASRQDTSRLDALSRTQQTISPESGV
jgi:hypothetical protein